ncbi:MAG TPA: FAD-dependent oxidoreductase [Phycisphaerae bacterium]|nr:FAD-dependent oxidoreductase [Phycisphaerae bacterium]HNU46800.1 FAD-dependent oxidoreductase [Phycisphaerae bacterium]
MPFLVRNLRLGLNEPEALLLDRAARRLGVPVSAVRTHAVVRRALDARGRDDIHFIYHLELALDEPPRAERRRLHRLKPQQAVWLDPPPLLEPEPGHEPLTAPPIVVGFGPAGMLAAWRLACFGYRPIVLERGRDVRRRHRDILQRFYRRRDFDPTSNLLFGEGGAGAYSDGKLYTRVHDPRARLVLEVLYQHGADPDILTDARPHIGSDRLPTICMRLRRRIEALGGQVCFEHRVDDLRSEDGVLTALRVNGRWQPAGPVVLAIGHSARDTVRMLAARGLHVAPKPFQFGVRIEHPQACVDRWQYGSHADHPALPPAEYSFVDKGTVEAGGDLFSFCMCPGGMILPTNESAGLVATNGASRASRAGAFANSGLVITLDPQAMGFDAVSALAFLEQWEHGCFAAAGGDYRLPMQRAADFLSGRPSDGTLETTYPLGGCWATLAELLPPEAVTALRRALPKVDARWPGFAGAEALLTAPESRASAPFRVVRDPATRAAVSCGNLYPVGEGAGYAGGIMSSAIDGLKSADALIIRYTPPSA